MDLRAELLNRVREDAEALARLANGGTNIPLNDYVDRVSLDALCDSLALDPEVWQLEDLERILVIRDGLYTLRNKLRDTGDDAEHSVEQILSAGDRLYADLERALRELKSGDLEAAQAQLAAFQRGPQISAVALPQTAQQMSKEAGEVMMQAHTSIRHIDVNLLKIDRSNADFEILKSIKISIQRLSASAFAIKLSAEQRIIYQGTFKLLNDGADRIVNELKGLLQKMKSTYDKTSEFIAELGKLAEQGTRFSRLVNEFLNKAFAIVDETDVVDVNLKLQMSLTSEAITCAAYDGEKAILIGKSGSAWTASPASGGFAPRFRMKSRSVFAVVAVRADDFNDEFVAIGTDSGLAVITDEGDLEQYKGSFRERIVAIATPPWGRKGSRGTIVSGSRDGVVRRWTLAEERLSQLDDQAYEQVGRRLQCMVVHGREVIAASNAELVFLDDRMRTTRTVKVPFEVSSMDVVGEHTVVLCGEGNITHVTLDSGVVSRVLTASGDANYCCVAARDKSSFYFGTAAGRVGVMEIDSGVELGSFDVGFALKGFLVTGNKLLAYGGDWNKTGRSAAFVTVETITRKAGVG